jgi:hypothetical protein
MPAADDDTLRIPPPAAARLPVSLALRIGAGIVVLAVAAGVAAGWYLGGPATPPPAATPATARQPVPAFGEAELLALRPADPGMWRLGENPRVFVLLFPDLEQQGAAALLHKSCEGFIL